MLWKLCLLGALLLVPRGASGEAKLRCESGACDFVVTGGAGDARLVLQPSEDDPRKGRLALNGFADLFPDWRPSEVAAMDKLFTWAPSAKLVEGSSIRLFDFAPNLTVGNTTGSAMFSVAGSLTRTGSANPVYQWTGFFTGTHFRSAASAICVDGPSAGASCTGDAQCPQGVCEGGSPLYQDAFYDASFGIQLRGHAIQHTWIPISFLSKPGLRALRTCGGGDNDDKSCTSDAQCTGGGTCQAAYLEQDEFYALYAKPSFHEHEGATLINRDYAAVVIDNPYVSGNPQIDRFTGLLCDPDASDWAHLPAETKKYCVASLSPSIKSRHAGAFRIGDASEPQSGLEVNGAITLDTGGDGTLTGSRRAGAALVLDANSTAQTPGPVRLGAAATEVPADGWTMLLRDGPLTFAAPGSRLRFAEVSGTWTLAADSVAAAPGFEGTRFAPTIAAAPGAGGRSAGAYRQSSMSPTFVAQSGAPGGGAPLRVAAVEGMVLDPVLAGPEGGAGEVVLGKTRAVVDAPKAAAGTRIADRRGLLFLDKEGAGSQDAAVALDVADQTTTSYAAAVRSSIEKGEGKWNLALTGTADSSIAGALVLGASPETTPAARLHVREPELGAEVVRVESGGDGGPSLRMFQREAVTEDANPVNLHVFVPEPGRTYIVEARVVARCKQGAGCDGESGAFVRRVLVRNARGVAKCVRQGDGADFAASEVAGWDAAFECSGGELQLRVQGDAKRRVLWQDTLVVQGVAS